MSIGLIFIFYIFCLLLPDNGGQVRKINISLLRKVHFELNGNATLKKSPLPSGSVITDIKFRNFTIFFFYIDLKNILCILVQCDGAIQSLLFIL